MEKKEKEQGTKDGKPLAEMPATAANLQTYNRLRQVPQTALKTIGAGRLKGMSDINPMWRIKVLTENFGPCGFGWKYEVLKQWTEAHGNEVKCFTNINLYVKMEGVWSEPIFGTGGSSFVTMERSGAYVSDECYKMALTDAISVATKALGVAADIYFSKDARYETKYEQPASTQARQEQQQAPVFASGLSPELEKAIKETKSVDELKAIWVSNPQLHRVQKFTAAITAQKDVLSHNNKS